MLKSGHRIKEQELETMLQDYYNLRGWHKNGFPKVMPNVP
jgi:aldehyde:ferredoxin oxidoreductase